MEDHSEKEVVSSEVNAFLLSKTENNFYGKAENIVVSIFRFARPSWWTNEMNRLMLKFK
jgi:hypothetical protein